MKPLVLTPGEPAGIGPDLALRLAREPCDARIVIAADPEMLAARARLLGLEVAIRAYEPRATPDAATPGLLEVLAVPLRTPARCGRLDPANAASVLAALRRAARGCLEGEFSALVTGPVHKGIINDAGFAFQGHTEFLAELTGAAQPVMMLAAPGLRVALATTHLPLARISAAITRAGLESVLRVLVGDLQQRFGIANPRIAVCGLNPHAGEGGHLGREEIEIIVPVLDRLRAEGLLLTGPLPADTAFTPPRLAETDAVLAMYHDQGLPVLKHMGFGRAVNITLGLPFIRTSVDHGTALELAGTGRAHGGSLAAAIRIAIEMARHETAGREASAAH